MEDGPYGMLASAIVIQAAHDYVCALSREVRKESDVWVKDRMIRDVESFVRSDWFAQLTTLDGEYLLQQLQQEARKEAQRHDTR
jgi:hypothetical protein